MKKNLFKQLKERGFIHQTTNDEQIEHLFNNEKVTFYLGIDPTADSLHIGHFYALMLFKKLQDAGHQGIIILGGGTGQVGDPSGRNDLREMMTKDDTDNNLEEIKKVISRFIKLEGENKAIIVNNNEWIKEYSYIDFIREIGVHFNVNTMLATESYANRLKEGGLTFLEMGYMLLQAYDFIYLNKKYNCRLQIGGSDQWANILAGTNLHRKLLFQNNEQASDIYGLTSPLLVNKDGNKMGKSQKGTVWVDETKTPVFDFYQYFYNVDDEDVEMLLKLFTNIPVVEINELVKKNIIEAKKTMVYEITKLVHGEEKTKKVIKDLQALYREGGVDLTSVPTHTLKLSYLKENNNIADLVTESKFLNSKSEVRRLIKSGGLYVNDEKVNSHDLIIDNTLLKDNYILLRRGKKHFLKIVFE